MPSKPSSRTRLCPGMRCPWTSKIVMARLGMTPASSCDFRRIAEADFRPPPIAWRVILITCFKPIARAMRYKEAGLTERVSNKASSFQSPIF